jgi:hypothetical protein
LIADQYDRKDENLSFFNLKEKTFFSCVGVMGSISHPEYEVLQLSQGHQSLLASSLNSYLQPTGQVPPRVEKIDLAF